MENISKEYGDGLFELAKDEGIVGELYGQTKTLRQIFLEEPGYVSLLTSRKIDLKEKEKLLAEAFSGKLHPYLFNFLLLMNERGYIPYVSACFSRFEERYLEENRILKVKVYSAVPLSETEKDRVKMGIEKKTGAKAEISWMTDRTLVAGLRIETDGLLIENSVRQLLDDIRRHLSGAVTQG